MSGLAPIPAAPERKQPRLLLGRPVPNRKSGGVSKAPGPARSGWNSRSRPRTPIQPPPGPGSSAPPAPECTYASYTNPQHPPIPPSLTAGALAPFRPEVRPPPPRVPKPIPEDRFYARPQPAPAAAPSSLPPKAAATHAPPVPRAQMAELGTQKVAVAELARRQLQRPPAGAGRAWRMTLKVTVGPRAPLPPVRAPPSERAPECRVPACITYRPLLRRRHATVGWDEVAGTRKGVTAWETTSQTLLDKALDFSCASRGCTKPLAYKSCKIIAPCKEKPSEMLACAVVPARISHKVDKGRRVMTIECNRAYFTPVRAHARALPRLCSPSCLCCRRGCS